MNQQNDLYEPMLEQLMIFQPPKTSLIDCISCYSENQIMELAVNYGLEHAEVDKTELCKMLSHIIQESYPFYLQQRELGRTKELLELQGKTMPIEDLNSMSTVKEFLDERYNGILFFFADKQQQTFFMTLPEELLQMAVDFFGNDKKVLDVKKRQNVRKTALALVNMYGICEKTQFYKVWNTVFDEEADPDELEAMLDQVERETDCIEVGEEYLTAKGMSDEAALEKINEAVEGLSYYMPSLKELDIYQYESIDFHSPIYIDLERYVMSKFSDQAQAKHMLFELGICSAADLCCEEIVMMANTVGMSFEHMQDLNVFASLYHALWSNSPSWLLRGYTPKALGKAEDFKPFASIPGVRMEKKIGRNEPCPCGSGKKYKHCCGKA